MAAAPTPRYKPTDAQRSFSIFGSCLQWMDHDLAHRAPRHHLAGLACQLDRSLVLVRPDQETCADAAIEPLSSSHSRRRAVVHALDRAHPWREAALGVR